MLLGYIHYFSCFADDSLIAGVYLPTTHSSHSHQLMSNEIKLDHSSRHFMGMKEQASNNCFSDAKLMAVKGPQTALALTYSSGLKGWNLFLKSEYAGGITVTSTSMAAVPFLYTDPLLCLSPFLACLQNPFFSFHGWSPAEIQNLCRDTPQPAFMKQNCTSSTDVQAQISQRGGI